MNRKQSSKSNRKQLQLEIVNLNVIFVWTQLKNQWSPCVVISIVGHAFINGWFSQEINSCVPCVNQRLVKTNQYRFLSRVIEKTPGKRSLTYLIVHKDKEKNHNKGVDSSKMGSMAILMRQISISHLGVDFFPSYPCYSKCSKAVNNNRINSREGNRDLGNNHWKNKCIDWQFSQ